MLCMWVDICLGSCLCVIGLGIAQQIEKGNIFVGSDLARDFQKSGQWTRSQPDSWLVELKQENQNRTVSHVLLKFPSDTHSRSRERTGCQRTRGQVHSYFFLYYSPYIYGQRIQVNILLFYSLRIYASEDTQCSCHHSEHYDVNRLYRQRSEIIKLIRNQVNSRVMLIK